MERAGSSKIPGKLFRLSSERAPRGTYESETHDAQMVSTWGALSWRGTVPKGSQVELATRSGNTETPDETWSSWSATYTSPDGSPITSPKARYLQWRAVLTGKGDGPILTSVTAAYLQRNLRPIVRSIPKSSSKLWNKKSRGEKMRLPAPRASSGCRRIRRRSRMSRSWSRFPKA